MDRISLIPAREKTVVRYLQGCSMPMCHKTWTVNEVAMSRISAEQWGRTKCARHRNKRKGPARG